MISLQSFLRLNKYPHDSYIFLLFLLKNGIYDQYIYNYSRAATTTFPKHTSYYSAYIIGAFSWENDLNIDWNNLHHKWEKVTNILPSLKFKSYHIPPNKFKRFKEIYSLIR